MKALKKYSTSVATLAISNEENRYLSHDLGTQLRRVGEHLRQDEAVKVLILSGGDQYFCAGASRSELVSDNAAKQIETDIPEIPRALLDIPVPTIAAMRGHAIGGGFTLGLWCDFPIAAAERLYGTNFMALGFTPGMGTTALLPHLFPTFLTHYLLYTGCLMTGEELRQALGSNNGAVRIVPTRQVNETASMLADEIAAIPYHTLRLLKQHLSTQRRAWLESCLAGEQVMHHRLFQSQATTAEIMSRYPQAITERNYDVS